MIVAVASGKGGTGKTTVAAALSRLWGGRRVAVDLDVEAPNLHLFLRPVIAGHQESGIVVPVVAHPERCTGCGACSDICAFKAVLTFGDFPVVFPEMCHACGGCFAVCSEGVFAPGRRVLGEIHWGRVPSVTGELTFVMGEMRVGEAMSPPLIRDVTHRMMDMRPSDGDAILDAPPGTSCPAMQAVRPADVLVLVTEPTPFGLHDLDLAWQAFAPFGVPAGVVINRAGGGGLAGDAAIEAWCVDKGLPVLARLSFDRAVAEAYAQGVPADAVSPEAHAVFADLVKKVQALGQGQVSKESRHVGA
ncbi:MAG: ATP-binding protein [Rhodospirillaceae bacterium]|nr:ATP-binding protein [Rhodospirillaceae bacterium]